MSITIRPAREEDYDRLTQVWIEGWASPTEEAARKLRDELRARLPREVGASGWKVFAAERDGQIDGLLTFDGKALNQLFVAETARSHGIGKQMLDFAKMQMPDGFWLRTHVTNMRGHAFYERESLSFLRVEPHPNHPEEMFRIYAWQPKDAWSAFYQRWARLTPPLRANGEVVAAVGRVIEGRANVLLLGVTPELAPLANVAVDKSEMMIATIWPGDTAERRAVLGDWLTMPLDAQVSAVIGDGSLNVLRYADYLVLFEQLQRVMRPGARLAVRVYATPAKVETLTALRDAAMTGRGGGFHAFKWRIAMALAAEQRSPDVPVALIKRAFDQCFPDRAALSAASGWNVETIGEIDAYECAGTIYSFPREDAFLAALPPAFKGARFQAAGSYELAERCPILIADYEP